MIVGVRDQRIEAHTPKEFRCVSLELGACPTNLFSQQNVGPTIAQLVGIR
jgi:hypothetical protein